MTTTISVSEWTKERLEDIKKKRDHGSYDSVVREMIIRLENIEEPDDEEEKYDW